MRRSIEDVLAVKRGSPLTDIGSYQCERNRWMMIYQRANGPNLTLQQNNVPTLGILFISICFVFFFVYLHSLRQEQMGRRTKVQFGLFSRLRPMPAPTDIILVSKKVNFT